MYLNGSNPDNSCNELSAFWIWGMMYVQPENEFPYRRDIVLHCEEI
jgi:hypothetical protein